MRTYVKYMQFIVLFLMGYVMQAQSNPVSQHYDVIKNDTLEGVTVQSMFKPIAIDKPDHGTVNISYAASGLYAVEYIPDTDYVGEDFIVLEYYENQGGPVPKYIQFSLDVHESIINTFKDYVSTNENTPVSVDPLSNDYASHGPLSLLSISFTNSGSITNINGTVIEFTPEQDFSGKAYFNYVVQDSLGTTASGAVVINVQDSVNVIMNDTIKMATTNKNPATLLMPFAGFTEDPSNPPMYGDLSFLGPEVIEYVSDFGTASVDTFGILNGNYYRTVIIETIHIPQPNGFVIDDYVITKQEEAVTFDVQANDLKQNFNITNYSDDPSLVQDSSDLSVFTYTPPAGFSGEVSFTYTVYTGSYSETGDINIWVNNFEPQNNATYYLSTPKNTPLLINYDVPISNYSFVENASPINGGLSIYPDLDTISVGCEEISGYNMVVYEPELDFIGDDAFEIEYCVNDSTCELVKVFVDVKDIGLDSICLCIEDCVWMGDADSDGIVTVADLLPIAYHQGEVGSTRDEAGSSSEWFGQNADDWGKDQMYAQTDVKHVDSNGDGIIEGDDVFEISDYYNQHHSLLSPSNLIVKDFPFTIETEQDTVYAGEVLHLDVIIGSDEYPVLNLNGLAYALNVPAALIDSSSLSVDFLNNSWFGLNAPSMEMFMQPTEGRIESSFARVAGLATSGYGRVATIDFIIENDLEGVHAGEEVVEVELVMEALKATDGNGGSFTLPSFTKKLYVDLRGKQEKFTPITDVVLYPNPTQSIVNIHAQKGEDISKIDFYNMQGSLIQSNDIGFTTARIDVSTFEEGIYIAQVHTSKGIATKKFVVH